MPCCRFQQSRLPLHQVPPRSDICLPTASICLHVTSSHRALHVSSGKPHAALFYLEQVVGLEQGASFEAEDAPGTHLNAACALGQLRQYNEAISHCRCALVMLRNTAAVRASHLLAYKDDNDDDYKDRDDDARDDFSTTRPAPDIQSLQQPTDRRIVRALLQLAGFHEAAGNVDAALGAWLR